MSRVDDAWTALKFALDGEGNRAGCLGDERFISDTIRVDELAPICHQCPLLTLCRDYAAAAKPTGGIWAGRRWKGTSQ